MTKILLILFLFFTYVFSVDQMKIKAKQKHNIVRVKTTIPYKLVTYLEAQKHTGDKNNARFITQISAEVDKKTVFQMTTGPSLSSTMLKFTYQATGAGNAIKIIAQDNVNHIMQKSTTVKKSQDLKKAFISQGTREAIDYRVQKPKAWGETTINNAIAALYGKVNFIDSGIQLDAPKCVYGRVPIEIKSNLKLTSIAVFQSSSLYPTTAVITVYENQPIDYKLWVKVMSHGPEDIQTIIVIGQDREGKLYRAQQQVNAITYTHHHCNENGEVEYDL